MDYLTKIHNRLYAANRAPIWDQITLDYDAVLDRFARVSSQGMCQCGKHIFQHPYSEQVQTVLGDPGVHLYELCDGSLGHS